MQQAEPPQFPRKRCPQCGFLMTDEQFEDTKTIAIAYKMAWDSLNWLCDGCFKRLPSHDRY